MNKYTYLGITGLVATLFTVPAIATVMMDGSLQNEFNKITSGPTISAAKDQISPSGLWSMASSGGSENVVIFTDNSAGNAFGIYDPQNPNNQLQIFSSSATNGTSASLNLTNNDHYTVTTINTSNNTATVTSATFTNTNNSFGYYVTNSSGQTFFSDSSLNSSGIAQMVAYEGNASTLLTVPGSGNHPARFIPGEYLLGFDSNGAGNTSTSNYTSGGVYEVESVVPNPEPSMLSIFGLGLLMIGLVPRVRRS